MLSLTECCPDATCSGAKVLFKAAVRAIFGVEPEDLSFLHLLAYIASSKEGLEKMSEFGSGLQEFVIRGGSAQLSERLAKEVQSNGGEVLLDHPVQEVSQTTKHAVVQCFNGRQFHCKRVVVAMPPVSASKIRWTPQLPHARSQLHQRNFMGCIIKVVVFYQDTFWRSKGYSGMV